MVKRSQGSLYSALLKYWRGQRGMSQLDLAVAADVSTRHISFLETGRAQPSEDMLLRLAANLDVPLREQNAMLNAAGFDELFEEPSLDAEIAPSIAFALERMFAQHEPFPMMAMNHRYDVLRTNHAAQSMMALFVADPSALKLPLNAYRMLFDPRLSRNFVVDWEHVGQALLSRLHREALRRPEDEGLRGLLDEMLTYPDVPSEWRQPDLRLPNVATYTFRLAKDDLEMAFLTTVTTFSAPSNITLEELQIESYFPLDEATEQACRKLALPAHERGDT